jgi:AraC-like DNA-binding protein
MDSLSLILDDLYFEEVAFTSTTNRAPWRWQLCTPGGASAHLVMHGQAWLVREDAEPLCLEAGDLVVLPSGLPHGVQDQAHSAASPQALWPLMRDALDLQQLMAGHSPNACQLISAHTRFDVDMAAPLIRALPPVLHLRGLGEAPPPWLAVGLQFLALEMQSRRPAQQAILNRMGDILFIQCIRDHVESVAEGSGNWLAALKDMALSAALAHIHQDPRRNWTVPELAQEACLSRSAFAERFTQTMGEPPLTYLTRHRMRLAARHLGRTVLPVNKVANLVGYASETAFSQAFKREFGMPPTQWRQKRQTQDAIHAAPPDEGPHDAA